MIETTVVVAQSSELLLGNLTTRMHNVAGEVFLLSERVLEVRGFVYDGQAPAAYFWADTFAVPSTNGFRLNDGSPSNSCGTTPLSEANGTVTYRVEFPDDTFIFDILGGSISIWCENVTTNFGEVIVPNTLSNIPDTASGPELKCASNITQPPVTSPTSVPAPAPPTPTSDAPVTVTVPTSTTNEAPVISPTSAITPTKSSPVAAPAPAVSTSAAGCYFGYSFSLRCLVATTMMLSFLRHTFGTI